MSKRKTHEEFCKEVYDLVEDEYSILGKYKNANTHILMIHNICQHEYPVTPSKFLNNRRCPRCAGNQKKTQDEFNKEVFNLVENEYTVLGEYKGWDVKLLMKHNNCNHEYPVSPNNFLKGERCPKCELEKRKYYKLKRHCDFIKEVFNLVGEEYTVLTEYKTSREYVLMRHNNCGYEWDITPNNFLRGYRCPNCNSSKGEIKVKNYLVSNNIKFDIQFRFANCRNKNPLPFDFVILNKRNDVLGLIEYDGIIHYEPIELFGGTKELKIRQCNDKIKTNYCLINNISLLRIPYWKLNNIEVILNDFIQELLIKDSSLYLLEVNN